MLLLAGDGIREGTESIVQYVGRHSGLHLTFGLVEIAGYQMPDGRLLVQPRILARTINIERAVVRIEGPGAGQAQLLTPEEAAAGEPADDGDDSVALTAGKRSFDPVVMEADKRWRAEFVRRIRFDDPAQATGRVGYGRVFLELPVPWAWMTAYSSRRLNQCGNTLLLKGEAGHAIFADLEAERDDIEAELKASGHAANFIWRRGDPWGLDVNRVFPGSWSLDEEPDQLAWLLDATNAFVNTIRHRVLRLLQLGAPSYRIVRHRRLCGSGLITYAHLHVDPDRQKLPGTASRRVVE